MSSREKKVEFMRFIRVLFSLIFPHMKTLIFTIRHLRMRKFAVVSSTEHVKYLFLDMFSVWRGRKVTNYLTSKIKFLREDCVNIEKLQLYNNARYSDDLTLKIKLRANTSLMSFVSYQSPKSIPCLPIHSFIHDRCVIDENI
jgi:hypothetical protein